MPVTQFTLPECRLRARKFLPYITRYVMSLIPISTPGLPCGIAVDRHGRLYYDPKVLNTDRLDIVAAKVLMESTHLILKHYRRAEKVLGTNPTLEQVVTWNVAADLAVWMMLDPVKFKDSRGQNQDFPFPPGTLRPKDFGIAECDNLTVEEIYRKLEGSGKIKIKTIKCPEGGSAADGQKKPWEKDAPGGGKGQDKDEDGKKLPAALSQFEQDQLNRGVAREIEGQKGKGNIPGGWKRFADEILEPQTDPLSKLRAVVKYAVNSVTGFGNHTYRKLNRRQPPAAFRLPAHYQPKPNVLAVIDTSGSMSNDDLAMALGVVATILKNHAKSLRVITGDTQKQACCKVFHARNVELAGGGGTDMSQLLLEATADERCDVVVCISDGITNWPTEPLQQRLVICLTQAQSQWPTPDWAEVVELKPKRKE